MRSLSPMYALLRRAQKQRDTAREQAEAWRYLLNETLTIVDRERANAEKWERLYLDLLLQLETENQR